MKSFFQKYIVFVFFALLFVFILINLTNTPGFYDSAEFAISYINNSITHPPSYPFTYLINKAIGSILPFHTMWKLHFINSLYGFVALIFFYLYLSFFTKNKLLKIIMVLQLFFADYFLNYTFNLEVYSLLFLFTSMFFYFYEKTKQNKEYFNILLYIFATGLIVHPLFLFLFPFLVYGFLQYKKITVLQLILIILPFLSYLTLIGLSKNIPLFNWESPSNIKGLIHIILRRGYEGNTISLNLKGLHITGQNILLNMSIFLFIIPYFFIKNYKLTLLYITFYIISLSLIFDISPSIFDWSAFFFPVYILTYGIIVKIVEKIHFKKIYIIFIFPLFLFVMHFDYLPFGNYPYPDAYFNDVNKKVIGKKNIVFVNDDSLLFISYLKYLQKKSNFIPIVPTLINYKWYVKSMKKYTKLKFPKENKKYSLYEFMIKMNQLNPQYNFYNSGIVDSSFKTHYIAPPTLLVKLNLNSFKVIDYKEMEFMQLPPKKVYEYKIYRYQYLVYIKNMILYYLEKNRSKALYYLQMLPESDPDFSYLSKLVEYEIKKIKKE